MAEITGMSGPVTKIDVVGGVPGAAGVSVTTAALDADGHLLISKSNGTTIDVGKVRVDVTPEVQAALDGAVAAETEATTQAGIAVAAASQAKGSETKAAASAAAASGAAASEAAAKTSETNAALSATSAAGSATTATTAAGVASSAATAAATSASNAALAESAAATSESNAATSASNAATSESNAATSESQAAASAGAAQTAAASASTARDQAQEARSGAESAADSADAARDQAATSATTCSTWFLRGSGSPLGVVTPSSAGVQYVDLAATNGARVWISTGNKRWTWSVVDGDTGKRNITSLLINGWSASSVVVQRVNRFATVQAVDLRIADGSAGGSLFAALSGFALPTSGSSVIGFTRGSSNTLAAQASVWSSSTTGTLLLEPNTAFVSSRSASFSWPTNDTWPTTLPGTPA